LSLHSRWRKWVEVRRVRYSQTLNETSKVFSLRDMKVVRESLSVTSEGCKFQAYGAKYQNSWVPCFANSVKMKGLHNLWVGESVNRIKLAYNPCPPHGRLKLTAGAFNRLKLICRQSWQHGPLLRKTKLAISSCVYASSFCDSFYSSLTVAVPFQWFKTCIKK